MKTRRTLIGTALLLTLTVCGSCGDGNDPSIARTATATQLAAEGERAFFDTLYGIADRQDETIALLAHAVAKNPNDGRSFFLLGMMHLYRFSQNLSDVHNAGDDLKREIGLAQTALDQAVPLQPDDRRIPGFRGATTYMNGVANHDAERTALGVTQLREAIAIYPEFNNFSFIGTVANVVSASDPLFQEAFGYIGDPLMASCNPFTQPQICGNAGKAPHNAEGALVLFGDLYAKKGNLPKARFFYQLSLSFDPQTTWRFKALALERLRTLAERLALYKDDDPTNDPQLIGYRAEACVVCHNK